MVFVAFVSVALGAVRRVGQNVDSCGPAFSETQATRNAPTAYADQALASIPQLYPRHELLVTRRSSTLGDVWFSLLVYKRDGALDPVTIEGVAERQSKAWRFSATCPSAKALDGVVTVLERVGALR